MQNKASVKHQGFEFDEFCTQTSTSLLFKPEDLVRAKAWEKKTKRSPFFYLTLYLLCGRDEKETKNAMESYNIEHGGQVFKYQNLEREINRYVKGEEDAPFLELEQINKDLFLQQNRMTISYEPFLLNKDSDNINVLRKNIKEMYQEFLMQRSSNYDITTDTLNSVWPKYLGSFRINENLHIHTDYVNSSKFKAVFKEGSVLDFICEPIRGNIEKRKSGNTYAIYYYSLKSFIGIDDLKLFHLHHENHEIWNFLTDFDFVRLVPIIEAIHQYPRPIPVFAVVIRVEVWLTSNVITNSVEIKVRQYGKQSLDRSREAKNNNDSDSSEEEEKSGEKLNKKGKLKKEKFNKEFIDDPDEIPDSEVIFREKCKGVRESLTILFELFRVKKTIYPMLSLKQKTPYLAWLRKKANRSYNYTGSPWLYNLLTDLKREVLGKLEIDNTAELFTKYYIKDKAELENDALRGAQKDLKKNPLPPQLVDSLYDENIKLPNENETKFDYNELLKVTDSNNYKVFDNPTGMKSQLHDYQKQGLSWILVREGFLSEDKLLVEKIHKERKLNPMWEEQLLLDGTLVYFNNFTGGFSTEFKKVKESWGGVLADEMGLGKTLMMIAAIHINKPSFRRGKMESEDDSDGEFDINKEILRRKSSNKFQKIAEKYIPSGNKKASPKSSNNSLKLKAGTLVIVPLTVLDQWRKEIETHSKKGTLSVYRYYEKSSRYADLEHYDVVLTTYDILGQEYNRNDGKLFDYHWHRLILDEAHNVKGRQTRRAKAACSIDANIRWCLTGTPIQNKLDDMFSLVSFLRIDTFSEYYFWNQYINKAESPLEGFEVLHQVIQPILLRRTKASKYTGGEAILNLPPKHIEVCYIDFSEEERKVYDILHEKSRRDFRGLINKGTLFKNYSHIFSLIMRLRQLCDHARIIFRNEELESEVTIHRAVNALLNIEVKDLILFQLKKKYIFCKDKPLQTRKDCHEDQSYYRKIVEEINRGKHSECPCCEQAMEELVLTGCGCVICQNCALLGVLKDEKCKNCDSPLQRSQLKTVATDELCIDLNKYKQSSKTKAIVSRILRVRDKQEKCVVFTQFKQMIKFIAEELTEHKVRYCILEGSLTQKERTKVLDSFTQHEPITVLIASLMVGAVGLNLVVANHVFVSDPWWNPSIEDQAIERVYRIGQKKEVNVVRFVCRNSIEEKIIELHKQKKDLIDNAIILNPEERKRMNLERVRYLLE